MARKLGRTFEFYSDANRDQYLTVLREKLDEGGEALATLPETTDPPDGLQAAVTTSIPTRYTITYWEEVGLYDDDPQIPEPDKRKLIDTVDTLLSAQHPDIEALQTRSIDITETTGGFRSITPRFSIPTLRDHHLSLQWGFLVPVPTGVEYEIKTGGIATETTPLEGIFLPLPLPQLADAPKSRDLLESLIEANQHRPGKLERHNDNPVYIPAREEWEEIQDAMGFSFEYAAQPPGYPPRDEGFLWIQLTDVPDPDGWMAQLLHETIALIYPNSD